jgi:hypothetical protein
LKTFNKFYGQMREHAENILRKHFADREDMGNNPEKWILDSLRKYGALDVVAEFTEQSNPNSNNRHYNAGYYDAMADLVRFIKTQKRD